MGTTLTANLQIPIVGNQDHVAKESINDALNVIDKNALHVNHALSKAHWDYWKENTKYAAHDIFRVAGIPSWAFFEVTKAGTSDSNANNPPIAYGEGDKVTDGTCELILRRINTSDTLKFYQDTMIDSDTVVVRNDVPKSTSVVELHGGNKTTYPIESGNSVRIYASKFGGITELLCGYYNSGAKGRAHLYYRNMSDTGNSWSDWDRIAFAGEAATIPEWIGSTSYNVNDVVRRGNKLWVCTTANNDTAFTKANWLQMDGLDSYAPDWQAGHTYSKNEIVVSGGKLYRAKNSHASTTSLKADIANWELISGADPYIPDWSATHDYVKDEIVIYKKTIYRALSKHTSSSAFTADVAKWERLGGAGGISVWTAQESYDVGQLVTNDGILYKVVSSHTAGSNFATDISKWTVVRADINHWVKNIYYPVGIIVEDNTNLYKCVTAHTSTTSISADKANWTEITKFPYINDWITAHDYKKDDIVIDNGKLYRAKSTHTSTTSVDADIANWEVITTDVAFPNWKAGHTYNKNEVIVDSGKIYRVTTAHTSTTSLKADIGNWEALTKEPYIPDWQSSHDYSKDDVVVFNGILYRALASHTSATAFITDNAKWEKLGGLGKVTNWISSEIYQTGQLVTYNGLLYKALADHTAGSSFSADIANWELVTANINKWQTNTYYPAGIIVEDDNILYKCSVSHTSTASISADIANWDSIKGGAPYAPDWEASHAYKINELVVSDSKLYRVKTAHTSTTSLSADMANWEFVGHDPYIPDWTSGHNYSKDEIVIVNGAIARAISAHQASTQFSTDITNWEFIGSPAGMSEWSANTFYRKNQLVAAFGNAYFANKDHTSSNNFYTDSANWEIFCSHINSWVGAGYEYKKQMTVIMNQKIYTCITSHTATTSWNNDKAQYWECVGEATSLHDWAVGNIYEVDNFLLYQSKLYRCIKRNASTANNAPAGQTASTTYWEAVTFDIQGTVGDWQANHAYAVGDLCVYNLKLYRCSTTHTSSANLTINELNTYWEEVSKVENIPSWKTNIAYNAGDIVYIDSAIYICQKKHTSGTFINDLTTSYCWEKLDQRCIIQSHQPQYLLYGELISNEYTGLRRVKSNTAKAPATAQEYVNCYEPVPASLVNYDAKNGWILNHLRNEMAYCGNKRLYVCVKDEPLPTSKTASIEKYSVYYNNTEQVFTMNQYDQNLKKYYGEKIIKLSSACDVTGVSFGRFYHKSGSVSQYAQVAVYVSEDGVDYKLVCYGLNFDNNSLDFIAFHSLYVKIRMYGSYGVGDVHKNTDALSTASIEILALSEYWKQIRDDRILDWDSTKQYVSQDVVVFNRKLYRLAMHNDGKSTLLSYDGVFKTPYWESLIADIEHWTPNRVYDKGTSVLYNHALFECLELHTSSSAFEDDLNNASSPKWIQISGVSAGNIATEDEVLAAMTE